jgi:hypothetical protein
MGLYAIAREELKSIEGARFELHHSTAKLDQLSRLIREESKKGVEASLSDFKTKNEQILMEGMKSPLNTLTDAVTRASERLSDGNFAYLLFFTVLGMLIGSTITFLVLKTSFDQIIDSQHSIKQELKEIKQRISPEKTKRTLQKNRD